MEKESNRLTSPDGFEINEGEVNQKLMLTGPAFEGAMTFKGHETRELRDLIHRTVETDQPKFQEINEKVATAAATLPGSANGKIVSQGDVLNEIPSAWRSIVYCGDNWYYVPTLEELNQVVKSSFANQQLSYLKESFDCEDYALVLKGVCSLHRAKNSAGLGAGFCCGMVVGNVPWVPELHCLNWVIYLDPSSSRLSIMLIEPQGLKTAWLDECTNVEWVYI